MCYYIKELIAPDSLYPSLAHSTPAHPMTPEPTQTELTLPESTPEPSPEPTPEPTGVAVPTDPTGGPTSSNPSTEDWEAVDLPGTVLPAQSRSQLEDPSKSDTAISTSREGDLLKLIHDLNKCNDALLARVSQLEAALNDSHQVLHNETEKAKAAQSKMVEQVSMQQASTQQLSQTAQQQIAKLVDQLEAAEQSFKRQQLINETLLSELGNAQERVAQLEHESALSAQQHAEEVQASVKAETTIKDLRSRLQRQQRYTLQFKTALEKSLSVTTRSTAGHRPQPISQSISQPLSQSVHQPLWEQHNNADANNSISMPKAQRIMPWAGATTAPFAGIDPHLENLIRRANQSELNAEASFESSQVKASGVRASGVRAAGAQAPGTQAPDIEVPGVEVPDIKALNLKTSDSSTSSTDTEAESQLWQDLERVIDERVTEEPVIDSAATDATVKAQPNPTEAPKFNWQQFNLKQSASASSPAPTVASSDKTPAAPDTSPKTAPENSTEKAEKKVSDLPSIVIDPYTVPTSQTPTAAVEFTEPSPWVTADESTPKQAAVQAPDTANQQPQQQSLSGQDTSPDPSVAPVVDASRQQKRINSLSAVQLPTFEKAKAGSFRR